MKVLGEGTTESLSDHCLLVVRENMEMIKV